MAAPEGLPRAASKAAAKLDEEADFTAHAEVAVRPLTAGKEADGEGGPAAASGKAGGDEAPHHERAVLPEEGEKEANFKSAPYFSLFRYADRVDYVCMALGLAGAAASGAAMPLFSVLFGDLLNSFGQNQDDLPRLQEQVSKYCLYFVYLGLGSFVAGYCQVAFWTLTGVRQVNHMRHQYLEAVLRQDVGYFDTTATSGRLLQGLNEDCQTIQQAIGEKLGMTIFNLTTALVGIIVAFTRGWDMTLVMLAITPALAGMGFCIAVFMSKNTTKINKAYADANSIAQQALGNIRTVYAFNGEQRTLDAYAASLEAPVKTGTRQGFLGGLVVGITNCVAFFAYALALWYGSRRVEAGAYTGGDVIAVLFSALIGGFALGQAAPNMQYFAQGKSAGGRIFEIMQRSPEIDLDGPGEVLKHVEGNIDFRNVTFAYPSRPDIKVFRDFSLTVNAGELVALVGESGSGKSTVVSLIERYYDPTAGEICIDGVDIRRLQLRFLRSQVGLVSQEPTLFATTIAENIRYGKPGCTLEEIVEAAKSSNAHNFIMTLPKGYDTHVGEKGVQMSGGQKQRIAIARAILKNPKVLLLDEATSALDSESERVVQDALDSLMKGRTTVVVAHRLSTVIDADKIAVVKRGRIVEQGTHEELMELGQAYFTLVDMQQTQADMSDESEEEEEEEEGGEEGSLYGGAHNGMPRLSHGTTLETVAEDAPAPVGAVVSVPGTPRTPKGRKSSLELAERAVSLREEYGVLKKTADGVGEAYSQGFAGPQTSAGVRAVTPVGGMQRGMSGIRRFVSFRRKAGKPKETKEVDYRKSTEEEVMKKVPISRLLELNRPELPWAFTGLLGSSALGLTMPAFAIALSAILSVFYLPASEVVDGARKWSLVFVGIGLGTVVAALFQSYSFNYMGQKMAQRVRVLMLKALLRQEVGWYDEDRNSSGILTSKLSSDAMSVKGQFGDTMGLLTQNLVTAIGGMVVAFISGWKMTLVVLACIPLILFSAVAQTKMMMQSATKEDETFAQANQTAQEAFTNIRTIAAFSMEGQVSELYADKLEKPTKEAQRRSNAAGLGFGFSQFVMFGIYALSFWYAGRQVASKENTLEEILKVFFAIFLAAMGAAQAQTFFPDVAKGKAATQRVFTIIDRVPKIDSASQEGAQPLEVLGEVELRNVTFAYPQRLEVKVFRNFNLKVAPGHTVALVGESGSGKSTVVGMIERFYDPQSGQVLLDGRDIKELNLRWLRDNIGLVGQEPILFNMTVKENIRYGRPDASEEEVEAAARAANAYGFITALPENFNTKLGEGGITLSGGQKQRVAIARAIVKNPKVLLLDEATSALDAESERVVQEALDGLMKGRTTVVVAHRLSTVRDADVIAVVVKGRIIEQGSHDELVQIHGGSYARLVRHQVTRSSSVVGGSVRVSKRGGSMARAATLAQKESKLGGGAGGAAP